MMALLASAAFAQTVAQLAEDAMPLPAYLDAGQVQSTLAVVDWQACAGLVGEKTVTARLSFQILPSGRLDAARWDDTPDRLAACWTEALSAVYFKAHAEEILHVSSTIALRTGNVCPHSIVSMTERDLGPLFLHIPPDATHEQRRSLQEALQP